MRDADGGESSRGGDDLSEVWNWLRERAAALGFSQIGASPVDLASAEPGLTAWLQAGFHGDMGYMARHGSMRARPAELLPGTVSVITARMDYLPRRDPAGPPPAAADDPDWRAIEWSRIADPGRAAVSVYARGRDYHRTVRQRLRALAQQLQARLGPFGHRVFADSAPVLEVELASRSGIGWRGKHTLALHRDAGSMFFLGEIFVDLALPATAPVEAHCGGCQACIDVCPTRAIVAPYRLDARRCISYLTIELDGAIPVEFRTAIGNRIYGCDDCQLACPWNKFARRSPLAEFDVRGPFDDPTLLQLWGWTEADFLRLTEGSAIRRIGYPRWRRNLAVGLGNLLRNAATPAGLRAAASAALDAARPSASPLLLEHIAWALSPVDGGPRAAA